MNLLILVASEDQGSGRYSNLPQICLQRHALKYQAVQPPKHIINAQLLGTSDHFLSNRCWAHLHTSCLSHLWNEGAELVNLFGSAFCVYE